MSEQDVEAERPDWIKCIRHTHEEMKTTSWCGRQLWGYEWAFVDIDHAVYNAMNSGRLLACKECVAKVVATLGGDNQ